jgi:hypothetical protein
LKSKFLLISCSTRHSKTPPFIINSTNNTSTFKIERKCIIFRELKNDGQSKVIVTQTSSISQLSKETGKTPFHISPTLMARTPQPLTK